MKSLWPPAPPGTSARTSLCFLAMTLVSASAANILLGMNGGDLSWARASWTLLGGAAGWWLLRLHHCSFSPPSA